MPRLKSANFAVTELASGITNAATSFQVVDASLFPNEGPFIVLVHDSTPGFAGVREIMEVGSINKGTNTFSDVLRGREGTSPVAHSAGARAECIWTAGTHGELADKVDLDAHLNEAAPHSGHETPAGAQAKADAAETNAKAYADSVGTAAITTANNYTDQEVTKIANNLASHKNDLAYYVKSTDSLAIVQEKLTEGRSICFPSGLTYSITDTLTAPKDNTKITIEEGAILNVSFSDKSVFHLTGDNCSIDGNGVINSPETWDPQTSGVYWEYAVVMIDGEKCTIRDIQINNVPRVGIGIHEVNECNVINTRVYGNMPADSVQTGHFGIAFDAGAIYPSGDIKITGNTISGCKEGIFIGSWGAGTSYGVKIIGNTLRECYDHGVYCGVQAHANIVTNNHFIDCSHPIAVTGNNNVVSNNEIYSNGSSLVTSFGSAISARDCIGNIIHHNIIKYAPALSTSVIVLQHLNGDTVSDNIVDSNYIETTGEAVVSIRVTNGHAAPILKNNIVSNNIIKGKSRTGFGLISVSSGAAGPGLRNKVIGNTIIITNAETTSNAIWTLYQKYMDISHNTIDIAFNAGSATTVRGMRLEQTLLSNIKNNGISCITGFGANITAVGINEASSSDKNIIEGNDIQFIGSLASSIPLSLLSVTARRNRISEDNMSGSATILSGAGNVTVTNANVTSTSRIIITASNAEAGKKPFYYIPSNGWFVIYLGDGSTTAADATYIWEIL